MKLLNNKIDTYYNLEYVPRQDQIDGLKFLKESVQTGNKYMLLNLPTGVGKSYLSNMFVIWYLNYINDDAKFDILTNSKILQKQYVNEFSYIRSLEGRSNYNCEKYGCNCEDGLEVCKAKKVKCGTCPYLIAMNNYINSRISLTNFHMFNISNIYNAAIKTERKSNVLIIDEASDYESNFCDYLTTELNITSFVKCGFDGEHLIEYRNLIDEIEDIDVFIDKCKKYILPNLKKQYDYLTGEVESDDDVPISLSKEMINKFNKQSKECDSKIKSLELFISEYDDNSSNWILDINVKVDRRSKSKENIKTLVIQPVWAHTYLPKYIFDKYDHVIFMSATILNKNLFCNINGLDKKITTYYEIDSPFEIKNRQIYYIKCGKMVYKDKINTFNKQTEILNKIFEKHKNDKGIIHTSNYEIASWIERDLTKKYSSRLIFHDTDNRDVRLESHITSKKPCIIVSPSMHIGVDLKDELSRFQVIMKMPYPNISVKKIKKRIETYGDWYGWFTVVALIQAYGRSIRSNTDYASTYIIDGSLSDVMINYSKFLPRYFTDAIKVLKF